ncbi:MAG: GtrA family protein [Eubacteriales bacterium]|nr:GtrA family protein [Eubacteriales bacterium]
MINKIKKLAKKYRELITYIIFGVLTTIVSLVSFKIFDSLLGEKLYLLTNIMSWIFAVSFAYITNKLWVFESKSWQGKTVIKELLGFVGARLFSLGVEELGLWLLIDILNMGALRLSILSLDINGNMIAKVIMQIVVIILNYVFSKLVVFKKK